MNSYFILDKKSSIIGNIKKVFAGYSGYNFIGSSDNYDEAMNSILKTLPNIVFIDLDQTISEPFRFIKELNCFTNKFSTIIAMSSTKDLAYEVVKMGFLDYLLKPLTELDIRKSMLKYEVQVTNQSVSTVCLRSYKDYQYLNTEEILFLKADNNATDFHMKDGTIISAYKTLKTFQDLLPNNFLRIHKSYIINSDYVSRINYGKYLCTINRCSLNIPFTKTYLNNVETINNTLSQSSLISLN